jgi:selenophosphate synthetase-related protein
MNAWKALRIAVIGLGVRVIGGLTNVAVMQANGGFMPVFRPSCGGFYSGMQIDFEHVCGSGSTRLLMLTDWIHVISFTMSIGDALIVGGELVGKI